MEQDIIRSNINTETRQLIQDNATLIADEHRKMSDHLMETQRKVAASTREMAQSVTGAIEEQCKAVTKAIAEALSTHAQELCENVSDTLKENYHVVLSAQRNSIERHEETMEAVTTVDEKLVDLILRREVKLVQGLDKVSSSVTVASQQMASAFTIATEQMASALTISSEKIVQSQKVMITGMVSMEDGLTRMVNNVGNLVKNHEALQECQNTAVQTLHKADHVIKTLVGNMERFSNYQERIMLDHISTSSMYGKYTSIFMLYF